MVLVLVGGACAVVARLAWLYHMYEHRYATAAVSASANMPKELTFMQKVMSPITGPMMSPKGGAGADPPVRV